MPNVIQATRPEVSRTFPIPGFRIRTDFSPAWAEVAVATAPELLFDPAARPNRSANNFYSSRAEGAFPIERKEAVYLLPPAVMNRFAGQQRLYYSVAVYRQPNFQEPQVTHMSAQAIPYIHISTDFRGEPQGLLTVPAPRGALAGNGYGSAGQDSLEWGGDAAPAGEMVAVPAPGAGNGNGGGMPANGNGTGNGGGRPANGNGNGSTTTNGSNNLPANAVNPAQQAGMAVAYDDGFDPALWTRPLGRARRSRGAAAVRHHARSMSGDDIPLSPATGGWSIGEDALAVGDIILSTTSDLVSGAIRWATGSPVSHAMIYIGDGLVVEAIGSGVTNRPLSEAISSAIVAVAVRHPQMTDDQAYQLRDWLGQQVGRAYDYFAIIDQGSFLIPSNTARGILRILDLGTPDNRSFICSELVLAGYNAVGLPLTHERPQQSTPEDIARLLPAGDLQYVGHLVAQPLGAAQGLNPAARAFDEEGLRITLPDGHVVTGAQAEALRTLIGWVLGRFPGIVAIHALGEIANQLNVTIGIGPAVGAGLEYGAGLQAGVLIGPGDTMGFYGGYSFAYGVIEGLTGSMQMTIIGGGIENFGGDGLAFSASGGVLGQLGASILFTADGHFSGVTVSIGVNLLDVDPAELYIEAQRTYAVGQALAASQASRRPVLARPLRVVTPDYIPSNPWEALNTWIEFFRRYSNWYAGVSDTSFFPHSAICLLESHYAGAIGRGTGFYIGPDRILTCAHNFVNPTFGEATHCVITPGKNGAGTEPFGKFQVSRSDWVIHPSYNYRSEFDLAVIQVNTPPPHGFFFDVLEDLRISIAEPIVVCGYSIETADPANQHLDGDTIREVSDDLEIIRYNLQTHERTSGSPVFYATVYEDESRQMSVPIFPVIGVHVAGHDQTLNQACRLSQDKIDWIYSVGRGASMAFGRSGFQRYHSHGRRDPQRMRRRTAAASLARRTRPYARPFSLSGFPTADVERLQQAYSAAAQQNGTQNSTQITNAGLRQLYGTHLLNPDGSEKQLGTTIGDSMAALQDYGLAGNAQEFEFNNESGQITFGAERPYMLNQSVEQWLLDRVSSSQTAQWHLFCISILDGYHSAILAAGSGAANNGSISIYWADQIYSGWDAVTGSLDNRITTLTQEWWDPLPQDRKARTRVKVWPLQPAASTGNGSAGANGQNVLNGNGGSGQNGGGVTNGSHGDNVANAVQAPANNVATAMTHVPGHLPPNYEGVSSWSDAVIRLRDWLVRGLRFSGGVPDTSFFPYSAICKIYATDNQGNILGEGSGFYVGPRKIVTAAHVLWGSSFNPSGIQVIPGLNGTFEPIGGLSLPSSSWVIHSGYNPAHYDANSDIAVITGAQQPPNGDYFRMEELMMSPQTGIIAGGYAADGADVDPRQQNIDVDNIRQLLNGTFTYGAQVRRGSSGGPVYYVFDDMTASVVGLNVTTYSDTENRGLRLTEPMINWINSI
ncbi:MAG: hypothetical protein R3293_18670 [Candidatus Promineifilaceae bacterium]|nr:hypothetical protein [Candidatus Promineifilaceae bacterium]